MSTEQMPAPQGVAEDEQPLVETERAELERLRSLINTPSTGDWMRSVDLEAAHQQVRWSTEHDAGKAPQDWFWLLGYLSGKAIAAFGAGDREKGLHHIISSAATLRNWHRAVTGENTGMRPGIEPPEPAELQREQEPAVLAEIDRLGGKA